MLKLNLIDNIYYLVLNKEKNEFDIEIIKLINQKLDEIEKGPVGTILITVSTDDKNFSIGLNIPKMVKILFRQFHNFLRNYIVVNKECS